MSSFGSLGKKGYVLRRLGKAAAMSSFPKALPRALDTFQYSINYSYCLTSELVLHLNEQVDKR